MSASDGVYTDYVPEPTDKSTRIMLIQVMRESLDGVPVKPSAASVGSYYGYQDAYTTGDMLHVDAEKRDKSPYYNDRNPGYGHPGRAVGKHAPRTATGYDSPEYTNAWFPEGKSTLLWEFRTAAFSAGGEDRGSYYAYGDWTYRRSKDAPAVMEVTGTASGDPGGPFKTAVAAFCSQRGFTLPGPGGPEGETK